MDKKNTMLLTVIAVATLLVAVVGATFAYFAVTNPAAAETQVGVTAGKIGTVSLTNNSEDLQLKVTTEDMKASGTDVNYYVVKSSDSTATSTGGVYKTEANAIDIATIDLTGADTNDTVKCQISIQVDLSGTMAGNLKTGDLLMTLKGTGYSGFDTIESFDFVGGTPNVSYIGDSADAKTGTVTFTGQGTIDLTNNSPKTIAATIWLVNSNSRDQKDLAGKTLTMKFTTKVSNCTTTSPAD